GVLSFGPRCARLGLRQMDGEDRTTPDLALHRNATFHRLREMLDDGEAETGAAHVARAAAVDAVEALEEARQMLLGDARTRVPHQNTKLSVVRAHRRNLYAGAGRVLDGVVHQVGQDLLEGPAIGEDRES